MLRHMLLAGGLILLVAGCGRPAAAPPKQPDPITTLLAKYDWAEAGPRHMSSVKLPPDFKLRSGSPPWRNVVDFSREAGLNMEPYAGQEVPLVSVPLEDKQVGRLEHLKRDRNLYAYVLLDPANGQPIGAYLVPVGKDGETLLGGPGPALTGRDLHEITGLSWPEYWQLHRAEVPPAERLAAEQPRNAIYAYFHAANAHDCGTLWSLMAEQARSATTPAALCARYEPLATVRTVEIQGRVKADTKEGYRSAGADEIAPEYFAIVDIRHRPGQLSDWEEGLNRMLIPLEQGSDGQWRLGPFRNVPLAIAGTSEGSGVTPAPVLPDSL